MFEQCPSCEYAWPTREHFLRDPGVCLTGYQASFIELLAGMFQFRHQCGATLTMHAGEFADLYDGPMFAERRTGSHDCPGYCTRADELRRCEAQCECAYVREIVQIIGRWPKHAEADSPAPAGLGSSS